ncbi:MAG TPA: hypothetical protein PLV25_00110, partial [Opitutales bacterium]|nr:hypothetical protein [Opitutales bacterium]
MRILKPYTYRLLCILGIALGAFASQSYADENARIEELEAQNAELSIQLMEINSQLLEYIDNYDEAVRLSAYYSEQMKSGITLQQGTLSADIQKLSDDAKESGDTKMEETAENLKNKISEEGW